MITLRGITWNHERGYGPLEAAARQFEELNPGVRITWDRRSLAAFGDQPLDTLVEAYDLIVLDHPHCGEAAERGLLLPLDEWDRGDQLPSLAAQSAGPSHASYYYAGHQWALAIDAAVQVTAWRPDLLSTSPATWDEVRMLARQGRLLWPLRPVDSLMSFFTLAANRDTPCATKARIFIEESAGLAVLEAMMSVARCLPAMCFEMSPIDVLEYMSASSDYVCAPLLFGYSNYARPGFRRHVIHFGNIPALGDDGPCGSILGGAGIGVSVHSQAPDTATRYAFWIASPECQKGLYFRAGGQPANSAAWNDQDVNAACANFFNHTRPTIEQAYLRPRHPGYPEFQCRASRHIHDYLRRRISARDALGRIERDYRLSQRRRRVGKESADDVRAGERAELSA